jgi:hypothetical protein
MLDSPEIWSEEHVNFILDVVKIFEILAQIWVETKIAYTGREADRGF